MANFKIARAPTYKLLRLSVGVSSLEAVEKPDLSGQGRWYCQQIRHKTDRLTWTFLFGPDFGGDVYTKQDRSHSQSYLQCKDAEHVAISISIERQLYMKSHPQEASSYTDSY